jgi:hypothetical protein
MISFEIMARFYFINVLFWYYFLEEIKVNSQPDYLYTSQVMGWGNCKVHFFYGDL